MVNLRLPLWVVFLLECLVVAAGFAVVVSIILVHDEALITEKVNNIILFSMQRNSRDLLVPLEAHVEQVRRLKLELIGRNITCRELNSTNASDYVSTWMALNIAMQDNSFAAFAYEDWLEMPSRQDPLHPAYHMWGECGCEQQSQFCGFNRNATRFAFRGGPSPVSFTNLTAVSVRTDANPGKASYVYASIASITPSAPEQWTAPYVWGVITGSGVLKLTNLFSYYRCLDWIGQSCVHSIGMDVSLDTVTDVIASFASTPSSTVALVDVSTLFLMAHNDGSFPQLDQTSQQPYLATNTPSTMINTVVAETVANCVAINLTASPPRYDIRCSLRMQMQGEYIASSYLMQAPNGILLMLLDLTPRSYHYAVYDSNRRTGIIVGTIVPFFVCVVCIMVWISVTNPLSIIGRYMMKAANMHSDTVRKPSQWMFLREVYDLHVSYEAMHRKLLELRPFVPHYLFVERSKSPATDSTSNLLTESSSAPVDVGHQRHPFNGPLSGSSFEPSSMGSSHTHQLVLGSLAVDDLNKFQRVNCTILYLVSEYNYADLPVLGSEVERLVHAANEAASAYNGIFDILRPDLMVISFGAHQPLAAHQSVAVSCALRIMRLLPHALLPYTTVMIDTAEYVVGTCGGQSRFAKAVFGERWFFMRTLQKLALEFLNARILCTEKTAASLTKHTVIPVDFVAAAKASVLGSGPGMKLFEVLDPHMFSLKAPPHQQPLSPNNNSVVSTALQSLRDVFANLLKGDAAAAIRLLSRLDGSFSSDVMFHKDRFQRVAQHMIECRVDHYERGEVFPFDTFGMPLTFKSVRQQKQTQPRLTTRDLSVNGHTEIKFTEDPVVDFGLGEDEGVLHVDRTEALFEMFAVEEVNADDHVEDSGEVPMTFEDKLQGVVWTRSKDILGSGTFANVYRGISSNGMFVALKCIDLNSRHIQTQDVVLEVNTACKLHHENIVNYISWVRMSRYLVIVMEFVPGGSLMSTLDTFGPLPIPALRRFTTDVLNGLVYLHSKGMTHADIKPHNILIGMDGSCKLSDFGSSVISSAAATMLLDTSQRAATESDAFNIRGTSLYMSPEVAEGNVPTPASDMWSLGISLYQLFTGKFPWEFSSEAAAAKRGRGDVRSLMRSDAVFIQAVGNGDVFPVIPDATIIPEPFRDVLLQCLQKQPEKRPNAVMLLKHAFLL